MFDEPVATSSEDISWKDVDGSSTESPPPDSSDFEETSSKPVSSEETSSKETSSEETSSEETSSKETSSKENSSLPVSSSVPIVPIVPPTELPPGELTGEGTEAMQTYFTEVRAYQESMSQVANNISVMSIVGILLLGVIIGLAVMKLVRL